MAWRSSPRASATTTPTAAARTRITGQLPELDLGAAYNTPWGSSSPFTPRVWNGSIIYNPAAGIYANFTATPVEGKSPLQVQFTDKTFTSDPNGVTKWEWDFNNDQIVDSTAAEPAVHLHRRRLRREVHGQPQGDRRQNGSSTETKKDFIVVNPFPVASATAFGQGSTVPGGVPGPMQMPAYTRTYSYSPTCAASGPRPRRPS
jgi:PKD repeat protein